MARTGATTKSTGSGGSGLTLLSLTSGAVDGSNQTFQFSGTPQIIVVNSQNTMKQVTANGDKNWTTITPTSVKMTVPPAAQADGGDIFALG